MLSFLFSESCIGARIGQKRGPHRPGKAILCPTTANFKENGLDKTKKVSSHAGIVFKGIEFKEKTKVFRSTTSVKTKSR